MHATLFLSSAQLSYLVSFLYKLKYMIPNMATMLYFRSLNVRTCQIINSLW